MKKFICLMLALLMLVLAVSCGTTPDVTDDTGAETTEDTAAETMGKIKAEPYDGVFKVGYDRQDITPKFPITLQNGNIAKSSQDPIYTTCVAINDGETTALIFTIDVVNISADVCESIRSRVNMATKVDKKNILISATHNHSTPIPGLNKEANALFWVNDIAKKSADAATAAIADLSDIEGIYTGTGKTTGMAFVRRYVHEDGTYSGIWSNNKTTSPVVAHETEADDTVQVMRFVRNDKKDVVIANWQAHAAHAIGLMPAATTADFVYYLRYVTETEDDDVLFAYYSGASANINLNTPIPSLKKYRNYQDVGMALGNVIVDSFASLERVEAGKIGIITEKYVGKILKDDPETVARAKEAEAAAANAKNDDERNAIIDTYGFSTYQETSKLIARNDNYGVTQEMDIRALSFGDVAFVTAPYEMFDTNGMEIKEGSPYQMTFVLTCAGGSWGYIPAAHAVPHKGYEVYSTRFVFGTAEELVGEYLDMLRDLAFVATP